MKRKNDPTLVLAARVVPMFVIVIIPCICHHCPMLSCVWHHHPAFSIIVPALCCCPHCSSCPHPPVMPCHYPWYLFFVIIPTILHPCCLSSPLFAISIPVVCCPRHLLLSSCHLTSLFHCHQHLHVPPMSSGLQAGWWCFVTWHHCH
jgi:hypothetical protein